MKEPSDDITREVVSEIKQSMALQKILGIYLKKQPHQIKAFLEQHDKVLKAAESPDDEDPLDPKSITNIIQA